MSRVYSGLVIIISVGLFIAEFLLLTSYKGYYGAIRSAFLLFAISSLIGILGIIVSFGTKDSNPLKHTSSRIRRLISVCIISGLGIYFTSSQLIPLFAQYPLNVNDVSQSDVIPQVMTMVQNFLGGTFAYEPITKWGYTLSPNYMPLTWLPFTIAEIFHFDYRWVAYGVLAISIIILTIFSEKHLKEEVFFYLFTISPWLGWYFIIKDDPLIYSRTIESINAAYYILLGIAILSRKPLWIGIGIAGCLLSRYSLVLWVPLVGIVYLFEDKKALIKIVASSVALVLILYVIPFFLKDPGIVSRSVESYSTATIEEWAPRWQTEGEKPYHLFKGIGMASFFYEKIDGSLEYRLGLLKKWHLWSSVGISILLMGFYALFRKRLSISLFLLASLKIYLVFFYYFIQIPYSYLYIIPIFISLILITRITISVIK